MSVLKKKAAASERELYAVGDANVVQWVEHFHSDNRKKFSA